MVSSWLVSREGCLTGMPREWCLAGWCVGRDV